jgi:hypothetical protein
MIRPTMLLICAAAYAMSGCVSSPMRQALDEQAIGKVQAEIKRQVGVYIRAAQEPDPAAKDGPFWCGNGTIDFDIANVKADLTTTIEHISGVNLGLKIPVSAVTLGPSAGVKRDVTNTEELVYNLWPLQAARPGADVLTAPVKSDELDGAPIAQVLLALRHALIVGAQRSSPGPQPCFTDYNQDKPAADPGNTFKVGLTFVTDATGGLDIKVGILDLSGSLEAKGTTGNTLTISFVQRGVAALQVAKDAVDAECKYPKDGSAACTTAKAAYEKLQDVGTGVSFH